MFSILIGLYILIPAVIAQICNPTVELVIPIEIPTKEAKVEMDTHLAATEAKISK